MRDDQRKIAVTVQAQEALRFLSEETGRKQIEIASALVLWAKRNPTLLLGVVMEEPPSSELDGRIDEIKQTAWKLAAAAIEHADNRVNIAGKLVARRAAEEKSRPQEKSGPNRRS